MTAPLTVAVFAAADGGVGAYVPAVAGVHVHAWGLRALECRIREALGWRGAAAVLRFVVVEEEGE